MLLFAVCMKSFDAAPWLGVVLIVLILPTAYLYGASFLTCWKCRRSLVLSLDERWEFNFFAISSSLAPLSTVWRQLVVI